MVSASYFGALWAELGQPPLFSVTFTKLGTPGEVKWSEVTAGGWAAVLLRAASHSSPHQDHQERSFPSRRSPFVDRYLYIITDYFYIFFPFPRVGNIPWSSHVNLINWLVSFPACMLVFSFFFKRDCCLQFSWATASPLRCVFFVRLRVQD